MACHCDQCTLVSTADKRNCIQMFCPPCISHEFEENVTKLHTVLAQNGDDDISSFKDMLKRMIDAQHQEALKYVQDKMGERVFVPLAQGTTHKARYSEPDRMTWCLGLAIQHDLPEFTDQMVIYKNNVTIVSLSKTVKLEDVRLRSKQH